MNAKKFHLASLTGTNFQKHFQNTLSNIYAKIWQKDDINKTLAEIHAGKTICGSAKKYRMAESTLCNRLKMISEGRDMVGSG